ncbi:hypothetical protein ACJX0J_017465, partial [Zea mays]
MIGYSSTSPKFFSCCEQKMQSFYNYAPNYNYRRQVDKRVIYFDRGNLLYDIIKIFLENILEAGNAVFVTGDKEEKYGEACASICELIITFGVLPFLEKKEDKLTIRLCLLGSGVAVGVSGDPVTLWA